jgi:DNA helicase-2/ATP-dependent DNA helicase PcrA
MNFHENPNLFIVGDMKQAIFRFQGASEANFTHFKKQYPRAREIVLEENYRSTQTILNVAGKLMDSPALHARAGHTEKPLSLFALSNPETEMFFVAHDIHARLHAGVSPESIAVFFRDNRDAHGIARALQKRGIPYSISGEGDIFSDSEIRKLIVFFRAVHAYGAEDLFVEALHIDFLSVPPLSLYALLAFAKKNRISIFQALRDAEFLATQEEESRDAFSRVTKLLGVLATRAKNESFFDFFEYAIRESGFLAKSIECPDSMERIESLVALFESAREFASRRENFMLTDFLAFVDAVEKHGVRIKRRKISSSAQSVQLMTAHKSKGMEFDYVYIIGATDGHWGGRTKREILPLIPRVYSLFSEKLEHDENDDERRLFFVALTRAKKHATITYPRMSESGAPLFLSQFANEIDPASLEIKNTEEFEREFLKNHAQIFSPSHHSLRDVKTESFVRQLFDEYGLSVTALNNYLSCPWKYFYMNLLRIPKAKEPHQMFGTAVHAALKDFFDTRKTRDVAEEFIAKSFALHLQRQDFSEKEFSGSTSSIIPSP